MPSSFQDTRSVLTEALERAYAKLVEILPEAVLAILVVVIGLIVAAIVYFLCMRILGFFAIDKLAGKTPLERMLKRAGMKKSISQIISLLVFWMTVLFTLVFASELLRLRQVSTALGVITRYIPQVIAAVLIVILGMLLARFLQTLVHQALKHVEIGYERAIGKAVYMLILVFVLISAMEQLGFDLSFITTNLILIILTCLAILGLGLVVSSRSLLENMLSCQELRSHLTVGDTVEIDGVKGKVKEFTLTSVLLENNGATTVLPARTFFAQNYTIT
jgi:hypothetical protein